MKNNNDADISLYDLLIALWQKKILIIFITSAFAVFSVFYALSLPNMYSSKAVLAPTTAEESLSSQLGSYSALAGLAGINIPNDSANKSTEAIERVRSYDFFVNEFLPYIKYENLVAAEKWIQAKNSIEYNENIFDSTTSEWVRPETITQKAKPSFQEAFDIYKNVIDIQEDPKTFYYNFTVEHLSPYIAQKWLSLIIKNINEYMRKLDKVQAENSIAYLNATSNEVRLNEIKEAISKLLTNQIQTLMLVEATEDYVFKPISSPLIPEKKSRPSRALICIFLTIVGFFVSTILAICITFVNFKKVDLNN